MSTDDVTAFLADVRMQAEDHHLVPADMVLPLLAFAEAALKLADDWEAKAREIHGHMTIEDSGPTLGFRMIGYQNHHGHAKDLREAITAALAGKEADDE